MIIVRPIIWSLAQTAASNSSTIVMNKAFKSSNEWTLNGCIDTSTQDEMTLASSGYPHHHNSISGSSISGVSHHLPASIIRNESGNSRLSSTMNWSASSMSSSSSVNCAYQLPSFNPMNGTHSDCGALICTDKCKPDCSSSSRTSSQSPPPTSNNKIFTLPLTSGGSSSAAGGGGGGGGGGSSTVTNSLHHNSLISSVTPSFTASSMSSCIPSSSTDSYSPYTPLANSALVVDSSEFRCNSMIIAENNHHHHHLPVTDVRDLMQQQQQQQASASVKNSPSDNGSVLHITNDNLYKHQRLSSNTLLGKVFNDYVSSPSPSSLTNPRTMDMSPESYMSSSPSPNSKESHHHRTAHIPSSSSSSSSSTAHHHLHHPKRNYTYLAHHFNFTV